MRSKHIAYNMYLLEMLHNNVLAFYLWRVHIKKKMRRKNDYLDFSSHQFNIWLLESKELYAAFAHCEYECRWIGWSTEASHDRKEKKTKSKRIILLCSREHFKSFISCKVTIHYILQLVPFHLQNVISIIFKGISSFPEMWEQKNK